jgi:hypothetical protein
MLKILTLSTMAGLLASPVLAAPPPGSPAAIPPAKVVSAASGAWTDNGTLGRAVLIDDPDNSSVDLAIYSGNVDNAARMKLAAFAHDIASSGNMPGNTAELRQTPKGALQVYSENTAVGRDKWERTMTLAFRKGRFVVAGVTMTSYDDLKPNSGVSCDLNYLSGMGKMGHKKLKLSSGGIPVEKWTEDMIPTACNG